MSNTRIRLASLLASACLVFGWGCGNSTPSVTTSRNEATVKGTVSIKGKPTSGGEIVFDPSNSGRPEGPRTAAIGTDGSYTIKTLVGQNTVTLRGPEIRKVAELQFAREVFDVKDGDNKFDFKALEPK